MGISPSAYVGHTPPCLTYLNDGDFPLVHHVTGGNCDIYDTITMHVHEPQLCAYLTANYAACPNPPFGVCGVNCSQYVDRLTDVYTWDFGNGSYLEENPCDFFTFPGCYPVSLSVITDNGCMDTIVVDTVCITGPHVSSYSVSPTVICACEDTVHFSFATVAATQLAFIYGCNGGFQIINPITPVGTENNPTILEFDIPYCVTDSCLPQITLGDQTGCQVLLNLPWIYIDTPAVNFSTDMPGACVGQSYCFIDSTVYVVGQDHTVAWFWDFGDPFDPTTSSLQNPCHMYHAPGTYPVTLSVISMAGCARTITKYITIHLPPVADFSFAVTDTCHSARVCFQDLTTGGNGNATHWWWNYGDSHIDTFNSAYSCHEFASEGSFAVHAIVTDNYGCHDDTTRTVNVTSIDHLNAKIGIGFMTDSCNFTKVCFVDSSTLEYNSTIHQWDFGNPWVVTNNPCITYNGTGPYTVGLRIADNKGCADTAYRTFTLPQGNLLTASFTSTNTGSTYNFTNTTTGNYVWWLWDFGDGDTSQAENPTHVYTTSGAYAVTLTVRDEGGCERTYTQGVVITIISVANIKEPAKVKIVPNPFADFALVEINGIIGAYSFNVTNALGETVLMKELSGNQKFQLEKGKLANGVYLYCVMQNNKCIERGRVVIE
jgi:PKD repeat protein